MKKLSKLMCLLLAVGMLMGIASCSSDAGEGAVSYTHLTLPTILLV